MDNKPVALFGAGGRMGQAIIAALHNHDALRLGATFHRNDIFEGFGDCIVAIDFTTPDASVSHAQEAARCGIPIVIGTSGFSPVQNDAILACAKSVPIMRSANMSVGITLLTALVELTARKLQSDYDIEIMEMHHRRKLDAPSGTALLLAEAAARGRDEDLSSLSAMGERAGARIGGQIGFASLRGGDVAGDHTVYFAGDGERLELTHRATSRAVFAQGALRAAEWVIDKEPGLYSMRDVLEIDII